MKKNKRYVRICAALLCAVLCLSVNVAPAMAAKVTQADIDALKGNAASLDKKQKEIQSKLNGLKNDKAAAVQKKTLLDDQIANTNAKISNTEAQISDYNALISQAEIELADAQQREEAQYELFCKRVREMEERGTISYWSVLFKANSFSDLLGSLDFINEVMDYDRRVIQDLQTLQAEIAEKKAGLEANKAALEAAKAELETQKKQLSAQRDEANKLVKEIDDNAAEYQATLKELEAEERRIEQQVKQMQKKLRGGEKEIIDFLMEKYKNLVRKEANAMYLLGGETDDLIQEGMIGLFKAIQNYQADKETSFRTFASLCIDRQLYSAVQNSNRQKHQPLNSYVSLSDENESDHLEGSWSEDPEALIIDQESTRTLEREITKVLSPMENKVLDYYLRGYGYVKIAEIMGKTPKSIDNALQRIRGKIRNFSAPVQK